MKVRGPAFDIPKVSHFPLYLYAQFENVNNRLGLYLGHDSCSYNGESFSVWLSKCSFSIFDPSTNQVKHEVGVNDAHIIKNSSVSKASVYISMDKVKILEYLQDEALVIHFTATFTSLTYFDHSTSSKGSPSVVEHNPCSIMKTMLADDVFTDAAIKVDEKIFKVHKTVLASQSDVFKRMFEADMIEKKEGIVEISDIEPEVMSDLLSYIYTGTATHLKTLAKELLVAADKYNLQHLIVLCEQQLRLNLTSGNVAEILLVVDRLPLRVTLKDACIKFIKHNASAVYRSDSWKILKEKSKDLALEVSEEIVMQ